MLVGDYFRFHTDFSGRHFLPQRQLFPAKAQRRLFLAGRRLSWTAKMTFSASWRLRILGSITFPGYTSTFHGSSATFSGSTAREVVLICPFLDHWRPFLDIRICFALPLGFFISHLTSSEFVGKSCVRRAFIKTCIRIWYK